MNQPGQPQGQSTRAPTPAPTMEEIIANTVAATIQGMLPQILSNPPVITLPNNFVQAVAAALQPPQPSPKNPLLNKPEEFTGDKAKYDEWLVQIKNYMYSAQNILVTGQDQIRFVCSYMTGPNAGAWKQEQLTKRTDSGNWDWDDFEGELKARFKDTHEQQHAQQKIATMKQGNDSAEKFFTDLSLTRARAGMTSAAFEPLIINHLRTALRSDIVMAILATGNEPTTVEGWRTIATKIDNAITANKPRFDHRPPPFKPTPRPTPTPPKVTSTPVNHSAGEPMDVDRMRKEGRCFRCQQKGHLSRDCPQKPRMSVRELLQEMTEDERKEWADAIAEMKKSDFA